MAGFDWYNLYSLFSEHTVFVEFSEDGEEGRISELIENYRGESNNNNTVIQSTVKPSWQVEDDGSMDLDAASRFRQEVSNTEKETEFEFVCCVMSAIFF